MKYGHLMTLMPVSLWLLDMKRVRPTVRYERDSWASSLVDWSSVTCIPKNDLGL